MYTIVEKSQIVFEFTNSDMCKSMIVEFMEMIGYDRGQYYLNQIPLDELKYHLETRHFKLTKVNMVSLEDGSFVYQI